MNTLGKSHQKKKKKKEKHVDAYNSSCSASLDANFPPKLEENSERRIIILFATRISWSQT